MPGPKIFQDPKKFAELMSMIGKYSRSSIARHFNVDHSTIYYHASRLGLPKLKGGRKMGEANKSQFQTLNLTLNPFKKGSYLPLLDTVNNERINVGKNYKDYVHEEEKRTGRKIKIPSLFQKVQVEVHFFINPPTFDSGRGIYKYLMLGRALRKLW